MQRDVRARRILALGLALASATIASVDSAVVAAAGEPAVRAGPTEDQLVVLFLGTSLTAGYGLAADQAYPALVQQHIDAANLNFRVVNAGVSGDTSAGGLRRLDWLLQLPIAVLVMELGANDMLRGLDIDALRDNLAEILRRTRATHPDARFVIAGMRAAPNLGSAYGEAFEAVFPAVAREHGAALIPFLLEDVAGEPSLNQADGIHPTTEGQRRIAKTVWPVLDSMLQTNRREE
jgi:acyl-CoA thioesterase-1